MADINDQVLKELRDLVKMMKRDVPHQQKQKSKEKVSRSRNSSMYTSDEVIDDFKRLRSELEFSTGAFKENSKGFSESLKDMLAPANSMRKAFNENSKAFRTNIRNNSTGFKEIANNTLGAFQKIIKSGQSFSGMLDDLAKTQDGFGSVVKRFKDNLSDATKHNAVKSQMDEVNAKRSSIMAEIESLKKKKKSTSGKKDELSAYNSSDAVKNVEESFANLQKTNSEYKSDYESFIKNITNLQSQNINILGNINAKDIQYDAFLAKTNDEQKALLSKLSDNIKAVNTGVSGFESAINTYNRKQLEASAKFAGSLKRSFDIIATQGVAQLVKDYSANKKYNITNVEPIKAATMGMSQEELSTLVGQNKSLFRILGNGNQNNAIDNGDFKKLTDGAMQFGLKGKEAADLAARFGNQQTAIGGKVSADAIKNQMDDFKKLSDATDMTVDQLLDFKDDLNKTGFIAQLNAQNADLSDDARDRAVNEEIANRYKLSKILGLSIDQTKEQIALGSSSKYKNIADFIKQGIGGGMAIDDYTKDTGIQISKEDRGGVSDFISGNTAGYTTAQATKYQPIAQDILAHRSDVANAAAIKRAKTGDDSDYFASSIQNQIIGSMLPDFNGRKFDEAKQNQQKANSQNDGKSVTAQLVDDPIGFMKSKLFGAQSGKTLQETPLDSVGAAANAATKGIMLMGEEAFKVANIMEGIGKNPLGVVTGGSLMTMLGGIGNGLGAIRGFGSLFPSLAATLTSGATTASSTLAAGATTASSVLSSSIPLLMTTAAGAFLTAVSGAGALALGAYLGNTMREAYDNSDTGKRRNAAADVIGNNDGSISGVAKSTVLGLQGMLNPFADKQLDMSDTDLKNAQIRQEYSGVLKDRFSDKKHMLGTTNTQFDNKLMDKINSGAFNMQQLKDLGANDDFFNVLAKKNPVLNNLQDMLNPTNKVDGSNLSPDNKQIMMNLQNMLNPTSKIVNPDDSPHVDDSNDPMLDATHKVIDILSKLTNITEKDITDKKIKEETQEQLLARKNSRIKAIDDAVASSRMGIGWA